MKYVTINNKLRYNWIKAQYHAIELYYIQCLYNNNDLEIWNDRNEARGEHEC